MNIIQKQNACQWLFVWVLLFLTTASWGAMEKNDANRSLFLHAEKALKNKNWSTYYSLKTQLAQYPLYPYLIYKEYIYFSKKNQLSVKQMAQFRHEFPDFPLIPFLKEKWVKDRAQEKNWQAIHQMGPFSKKAKYTCYWLQSNIHLKTHPIQNLNSKIKPLWLVGRSQPKACDPIFKQWINNGHLNQPLAEQRIKIALNENNLKLANYLVRFLPQESQSIFKRWHSLFKQPHQLNNSKNLVLLTENKWSPRLAHILFKQWSKKNVLDAASMWYKIKSKATWSNAQKGRITRSVAVKLAHARRPLAIKWLQEIPSAQLDPVAQEWKIRLSLLNQDWPNVLFWINKLPDSLRSSNKWQYWTARGLEQQGKTKEAKIIYLQLAKHREYYGFMSSLRIKNKIQLQHQPISSTWSDALSQQFKKPLLRVKELLALKRHYWAHYEWAQLIKNGHEAHLLALAKYAQKNKWHALAIYTMTKAQFKDDVQLRFPFSNHQLIFKMAKEKSLDPAWIFAIARQESAFFEHAKSPVGALGLMQLMPKTAFYLAKKHNVPLKHKYQIVQPQTNLHLGTQYLRNLKDKLQGSEILATASYNAGMSRILRWLPKSTLEADMWIETIPFLETRNYVKNVLTFIGIYRSLMGKDIHLEELMRPILARS